MAGRIERARTGRVAGLTVLVALVGAAPSSFAAEGYLRSPDLHGDRLVFAAEGDLWVSDMDGQGVRRITSHVGEEANPRFSPDGRWIAFTGVYDGNSDVYVMSVNGGEPRRLTWHPAADFVLGWAPDGDHIIFMSARHQPHNDFDAFTIPLRGGDPKKVEIGAVTNLDIDPDTGQYAFTRKRGGGPRKRYRGGTAPDIWVGHPKRADYRQVTEFEGLDSRPMWFGGRIYYLCDRGGTVNIWSMKPDGSDQTRHTDFDRWDAGSPAMGTSGRIVFTLAGDVHLLDLEGGRERKVSIDLPSERILTRTRYPDPGQYITDFTLAPDGDRVAVVTRGEIFSVPVEDGVTLPVTKGSGARERSVSFHPEGKRIVYISDESGEEEIVAADAWGRGDKETLRCAKSSRRLLAPRWSPDGEWVAYSDQDQTLSIAPAGGGKPRRVDRSESDEIRDYAWSPDGRWLAYSKANRVDVSSIFIYDTKEDETHQVTGWTTSDNSPAWDPKGRYLYFLSDLAVNAMFGARDFESITFEPTVPCLVLLRSDVENPLRDTNGLPPEEEEQAAENAENAGESEGAAEEETSDRAEEEALEPVKIEFDGLADRFLELPVEGGAYLALTATDSKIFFMSLPLEGFRRRNFSGSPEPRATLMAFDFDSREAMPFVSGVSTYDLQPGAGKVAFMKRPGEIYVVGAAAPPGPDLSDASVSLAGVVVELDPREEWAQIYYEAWRMMRDFYWDEGMQGLDWEEVRDQYAELLPRLATRDDLTDLLTEMVGELCTSHTYVFGGDPGTQVPRVSTGLLGAELDREGDAFRVETVYRGDRADRVRSPLEEPGVNVREGDYVLALNQLPFCTDAPFEANLENLAARSVLLTVNDRASRDGARDVVVTPISYQEEKELQYADWVRRNREHVREKTGGKVGYIHIPDMDYAGLVNFNRWFYPQLDREGMIVDVRWNSGGFVSQQIYNRLARDVIFFTRARWSGVTTYPYRLLNGPFVVLANERSGSDGDFFPSVVQLTNLAPVIGERSWGGVVGISVDKWLVDGGLETQPEYAAWDHRRGWSLENRGVEPDIEVVNLPQDLARGIDAQLDRAIEEVIRLGKTHPPVEPEFGPAPDRSRNAYSGELDDPKIGGMPGRGTGSP